MCIIMSCHYNLHPFQHRISVRHADGFWVLKNLIVFFGSGKTCWYHFSLLVHLLCVRIRLKRFSKYSSATGSMAWLGLAWLDGLVGICLVGHQIQNIRLYNWGAYRCYVRCM